MTVTDGYIQVAPDSTGKLVDNSELTVGVNTVERQRINIGDPADAAGLAAVLNRDTRTSDYGVVVRVADMQAQLDLLAAIDDKLAQLLLLLNAIA